MSDVDLIVLARWKGASNYLAAQDGIIPGELWLYRCKGSMLECFSVVRTDPPMCAQDYADHKSRGAFVRAKVKTAIVKMF